MYIPTVQITHNLNGTCMSHVCVCHMCKSKKHAWHQTIHVHTCKINAPHTRTYPYEVSATKQSSLQPVMPYALQSTHVELFLVE